MAAAEPQTTAALRIQTIGRFRVTAVLGRGSQGIVYLAQDPALHRQVALKTLRAFKSDPERLLHEARTAGRLNHPHIVPVFEIGEHEGAPYIVYEYVQGQSLRRRLHEQGPLPVAQALAWMCQILDAVAYAHAEGVIHRDLNPANILIGMDGTPRIMDFGISSIAGAPTATSAELCGTVNYLAPELLAGGPIDPVSDVFSLGLILHEMVTGRPAVSADQPAAALYRIAHGEIEPPSRQRPGLTGAFDALVQGALSKQPADRYPGAAAMKAALEAYRSEQGQTDPAGQDHQSTLAFLLRRMQRKADFPAIATHISEISRKIAHERETSAAQLAGTIVKDYALTTKLLKLVNSSFYGHYRGSISTVSRAVVVLGFKQVRTAALSLLLFEHMSSCPQAQELKETAGKAFLSGVVSRRLADGMHLPEPEQAFICSMFHTLGRYLTVYYFPEEYEAIQQTVSQGAEDEDTATRSVLGLTFEELGSGIAREWHLPEDIIASMRKPDEEVPGKPGSRKEALCHLAAFSNELTEIMVNAPPEEKDAAIRNLGKRFGKSVSIPSKVLGGVVESALTDLKAYAGAAKLDFLKTGRVYHNTLDWVRQGQTPGPGSGAAPEPVAVVPEQPSPAEPAAAAAAAADESQKTLLDGIQDITRAILEGSGLNDILVMVLETLFRGVCFSRVVLCIRDARNASMVARFGLGQDMDTLLKRFRFNLDAGSDVFTRAVREQTDIIWSGKVAGSIPEWHRQLLAPKAFVLYPIVVNRVCLGLIYADHEDGRRRVTESDQNYLNTLRNQAALAIKQQS